MKLERDAKKKKGKEGKHHHPSTGYAFIKQER